MQLSYLLSLVGLLTLARSAPALVEREPSPLEDSVAGDVGAAATAAAIPACWQSLSCSFEVIQSNNMDWRVRYVRYMESTHFGALKSSNQFRAIEAVIDFFKEQGEGAPGTWVSYVDAGIVEAIERGAAIALGKSKDDGKNDGTKYWVTFFNQMKAGQLQDRDVR